MFCVPTHLCGACTTSRRAMRGARQAMSVTLATAMLSAITTAPARAMRRGEQRRSCTSHKRVAVVRCSLLRPDVSTSLVPLWLRPAPLEQVGSSRTLSPSAPRAPWSRCPLKCRTRQSLRLRVTLTCPLTSCVSRGIEDAADLVAGLTRALAIAQAAGQHRRDRLSAGR